MRGSIKRVSVTDKEVMLILMVKNMRVNGKTTRDTGGELFSLLLVINIGVSF